MKSIIFLLSIFFAGTALSENIKVCYEFSNKCEIIQNLGTLSSVVTDDVQVYQEMKRHDQTMPVTLATTAQVKVMSVGAREVDLSDEELHNIQRQTTRFYLNAAGCGFGVIACAGGVTAVTFSEFPTLFVATVAYAGAFATCGGAFAVCSVTYMDWEDLQEAKHKYEQTHPQPAAISGTGGGNPGGPATGFPTAGNPVGGSSARCDHLPTTIVSHHDGTGSGSTTTPAHWDCSPITGNR